MIADCPVGPSAHWITHPDWQQPVADRSTAPLLRREITITEQPINGQLSLTGLGVWSATWDGVALDDTCLEPGSTDPRVRVALSTIDLTAQLTPGRHVLEIELGEGPAHVRPAPGRYTKFVDAAVTPRLIAQLSWVAPDGQQTVIVTDESWQTALGGTLFTHWYGGEDHDARVPPGPWVVAVSLGDRDSGPTLWSRAAPPVRVVARLVPQRRTRLDDASLLVDFGVNHAGRPVITVGEAVPAGTRFELWPAEDLDESGHVDQTSTGKPIFDTFIARAGRAASWHPRFCYHGYRYVEIRSRSGGALEQVELTSDQLRSDNRRTGTFACAEPTLNTIYTLTDRAVQSNLFTVLTDCPHREKLGWLEQLHLVFPTLAHYYDVRPQLTDMVTHMIDAQTDDGLVPDIAPELTRFGGGFRDDVNWGSAIVRLPYQLWRTYGDLEPARNAWTAANRYVDYLDRRLVDELLPNGLADWKTLDETTPPSLVHGHGYLQLMWAAAELAVALGRDSRPYTERAAAMAKRLTAAHVGRDGSVQGGSQAAYALALDAGLVPLALVALTQDRLLSKIRSDDCAMTVGEIGLPALIRVLSGAGRHALLLELVTQRRHPGYGHMIETGCTALAETWEVVQGEASANHFMLGYVVTWLTEYVAGLRPAGLGWRSVIIEPHGIELTEHASVGYDSPSGHYSLGWHRDAASALVQLDLLVPEGTSAELRPPPGWTVGEETPRLTAGRHQLHLSRLPR